MGARCTTKGGSPLGRRVSRQVRVSVLSLRCNLVLVCSPNKVQRNEETTGAERMRDGEGAQGRGREEGWREEARGDHHDGVLNKQKKGLSEKDRKEAELVTSGKGLAGEEIG